MSGQIRNIAHLRLKVGAEDFLAVARECAEFTQAEPGCLIYDWYLDVEHGTCDVFAVFESSAAFVEHSVRGFDEVLKPKLLAVAAIESSDTYGVMDESLTNVLGTSNRRQHGAPAVTAGRWLDRSADLP